MRSAFDFSPYRRSSVGFDRLFDIADHIQVRGADLKDGMLSLDLVREIPEAMKPRKIEISGSAPKHDQIETSARETEGA